MIIGTVCFVLFLAAVSSAGDGSWGAAAVGIVLILLLAGIGIASRESDKAYKNFHDYWRKGGKER